MLYKLKDRIRRARFANQCGAVLESDPVLLDQSSQLALLSQLQHKDVLMFLVAVQSFAVQVRPRAVFVLDDGSLTGADRQILRRQIPDVTFLALDDYRNSLCPTGGCWERLLAIASLVKDYYVVQLDSDTLTVGAIEEVQDCISRNSSFALATWDNQRLEMMVERCETAQKLISTARAHVQLWAEANFDKLADYQTLRYVRGCAGFAGFARHSFEIEFVEGVSKGMYAAIGDRWTEWGSEQVMSNIVVANTSQPIVLPHPKYADCHKMKSGETAFIHFIGSCRFSGNVYAAVAGKVIKALPSMTRHSRSLG